MNPLKWLVLYYLRFLARLQLAKNRYATIIGITGSAGKTSTRNAVSAVLKAKPGLKVKISHKANSETGIPLNILGLTMKDYSLGDWLRVLLVAPLKLLTNFESFDAFVVEMGIDGPNPPKNMGYLLTIIRPHIGIFLNASAVHSQPFDHLIKTTDPKKRDKKMQQLIAAEKGKLITGLPQRGLAIINADDPNTRDFIAKTKAPVITFGQRSKTDIKITSVTPTRTHTTFAFKHGPISATLTLKHVALSPHYGATFAAALAVGLHLGLSLKESARAIEQHFILPKGRMSLIPGVKNITIIDSSYNASTIPMLDALDILDTIAPKRKIAVLGDMRELGQEAEYAHQKVARKAREVADYIYLIGPLMRQYALPLLRAKVSFWHPDAKAAAAAIKADLEPEDTVLIKASQNTLFLEYIVEQLMTDPSQAEELLCRQTLYWDLQRYRLGLD